MDQVKRGSKTLFNFFFQESLAEHCKSNKGLDSPTPGPSTNNPSYATSFANPIISSVTKNQWITVLHQNDSSDKKEKTTFNPQWLEKYNLVAAQREVDAE